MTKAFGVLVRVVVTVGKEEHTVEMTVLAQQDKLCSNNPLSALRNKLDLRSAKIGVDITAEGLHGPLHVVAVRERHSTSVSF